MRKKNCTMRGQDEETEATPKGTHTFASKVHSKLMATATANMCCILMMNTLIPPVNPSS